MKTIVLLAWLLAAQHGLAQVWCVRAVGHTPQHERIFFEKGTLMAAEQGVGDLGPAPVFPEIVRINKLFANVAGERTNYLYTPALAEVPVNDLRLLSPGDLLLPRD